MRKDHREGCDFGEDIEIHGTAKSGNKFNILFEEEQLIKFVKELANLLGLNEELNLPTMKFSSVEEASKFGHYLLQTIISEVKVLQQNERCLEHAENALADSSDDVEVLKEKLKGMAATIETCGMKIIEHQRKEAANSRLRDKIAAALEDYIKEVK